MPLVLIIVEGYAVPHAEDGSANRRREAKRQHQGCGQAIDDAILDVAPTRLIRSGALDEH